MTAPAGEFFRSCLARFCAGSTTALPSAFEAIPTILRNIQQLVDFEPEKKAVDEQRRD